MAWLAEQMARETDDCILWPFAVATKSRPVINVAGKSTQVKVYLLTEFVTPAPQGRVAGSTCGQDLCVNLRHLEWRERRKPVPGGSVDPDGIFVPSAPVVVDVKVGPRLTLRQAQRASEATKLYPDEIAEVIAESAAGASVAALADAYGVRRSVIRDVLRTAAAAS